jgi:ribose 5-phosphate isomerase B
MLKILIASDHAGYELKEALIVFLRERKIDVEDCGAYEFTDGDDYPDFILPMAAKVAQNKDFYGIAIGGSGQGEAMVANRVKGVRAAVYYGSGQRTQTDAEGKQLDMIASTRAHNDANVLSLGARFITHEEAKAVVIEWLQTPFSGGEQHMRRIAKFN